MKGVIGLIEGLVRLQLVCLFRIKPYPALTEILFISILHHF